MINQERWLKFSYNEQMGHIAGELSLANLWEGKHDRAAKAKALERALDLIDFCKDDPKHFKRRRELCRLRELVANQYIEGAEYHSCLKDLEQYCLDFALLVNKNK